MHDPEEQHEVQHMDFIGALNMLEGNPSAWNLPELLGPRLDPTTVQEWVLDSLSKGSLQLQNQQTAWLGAGHPLAHAHNFDGNFKHRPGGAVIFWYGIPKNLHLPLLQDRPLPLVKGVISHTYPL